MEVVKDTKPMQQLVGRLRLDGKKIGFVPTMGALHEGHLSLVDVAKKHADIVVMSIYLNPAQFNNKQDLATYPSNLERDLELAKKRGVDIVFCPTDEIMYPKGFQTYVETLEITKGLCGSARPGHFKGVTTVVLKLFNIVKPDIAIFGRKDYQQFKVIEQMARDLDLDIKIIGAPIIREPDGLAMSSRNVRLSDTERREALTISGSFKLVKDLVERGENDPNRLISGVREMIESTSTGRIDYIKICDADTLTELTALKKPALLAIAAYFGQIRLIDNRIIN